MKNIINEKPRKKLTGRLAKTVEFVDEQDIKGKTILDIGCGYGWFENNLLARGAKMIVGMELTEVDLKTIKKFVKDPKMKFAVGSAIDLPFKTNYFDTVTAWEVIEHIPKGTEHQMFSEVKRVLKKDGIFYLSTPFDQPLVTYADPAWWLVGHRHYSQDQLREYAQESGFKVQMIMIRGGIWMVVSLLNMYISKWLLRRKPLFQTFFTRKENEEYAKEGFVNIFVKYKKM